MSETRLSEALRLFMETHRYSIRVLAKEVGIPAPAIERLRTGRQVSVKNLMKFMAWFTEEL